MIIKATSIPPIIDLNAETREADYILAHAHGSGRPVVAYNFQCFRVDGG